MKTATEKQPQTAINEGAVAMMTRRERSLLYVMLSTARTAYTREHTEDGKVWAGLARRTMEAVATNGVDV